ncbi:MAG: DUF308 domain-containing protein [Oscillospiraceae bacterium]|nr:DUF308 domain-containing protein [Oscillospiraceae bacterium]
MTNKINEQVNEKLEFLKRMKVASALIALVLVGVGFFLMFYPFFIMELFSLVVATGGVFLVMMYILAKDRRNGWDLLAGILHIIFGVTMLLADLKEMFYGVVLLEYIMAFWIVFAGICNIGSGFGMKKATGKSGAWVTVCGVLSIIAGLLFLSFPIRSAFVFTNFIGIFAGVSLVFSGFSLLASALSGKNFTNPEIVNAETQSAETTESTETTETKEEAE